MLFCVCSKCEQAKWVYEFGLRYRNGNYSYKSICNSCNSRDTVLRNKRRMQADPEFKQKQIDRLTQWGIKNKEKRLAIDATRRRNKYASSVEYKARVINTVAQRRARKLNATPSWLSEEDKKQIERIYKVCSKVSEKTNRPHDVDHIVPLQGENVCGLHVPWNLQILPASMNRSKNNAYNDWGDFADCS